MKYQKIYFVGIKGVGLAPLAIIAKQAGFEVAGSDVSEIFITDETLKKENITIFAGFHRKNIDEFIASSDVSKILLITTAAHGGFENEEVKYAKEKGIQVMSHGEAVGFAMSGKLFDRADIEGISVAGSHGKTTISAMLATFLTLLGKDPSYTVGTSDIFPIGSSGHYGKGKYFVAEADEYVSEMKYDPTPKLLYQFPLFAIINNIDFDHPDIYKDISEVVAVTKRFIAQNISDAGTVFVNGDDERLSTIKTEITQKKFVTYGFGNHNDYFVKDIVVHEYGSQFEVFDKNGSLGTFTISIPGNHNVGNVLSAIALLRELGIDIEQIKKVLPQFKGSKRRLEKIGEGKNGVILIDDYGHHPKEIVASLSTLKSTFNTKKIICIFQAHTYSRTQALLAEFLEAFSKCDQLIVLPTFSSKRDAGGDDFDDNLFMAELKKRYPNVLNFNSYDSVVEYCKSNFASDSYVIVTMGAGDIYKINLELNPFDKLRTRV